MDKPKVKVLITLFAYSGNGGIPGTIPEIAVWLAETAVKLAKDERVAHVATATLCDTPITMTRNRAIKMAQEGGFDMVLMLDSDNEPDGYFGKCPNAKRFMDVGFDFAYDRLVQGKPTVIAAPYCGPPPHPIGGGEGEVPYLFEWINDSSEEKVFGYRLHRLNRNEAARMSGIQPVAALPTGVCLFTVSAFVGMSTPYFAYEMNADHTDKQSTEDVYATRNISLFWHTQINEDVVFAACDSWALHHKVKKVGRPELLSMNAVHKDLQERYLESAGMGEKLAEIDFTEGKAEMRFVDAELTAGPSPLKEEPKPIKGQFTHTRRIGRRVIGGYKHQTPMIDLEALSAIAADESLRLKRPIEIAEIGSWVGESAVAFVVGMDSANNPGRITCIDTWEGTESDQNQTYMEGTDPNAIFGLFARNMKKEIDTDRVRVIKGDSIEVANQITDQVDIVFLDAGHSYEEIVSDIKGWLPHVMKDGILCGHDYCPAFPGVIAAVDQLKKKYPVQVMPGTSVWVMRNTPNVPAV
jgi:predicted O-methyltransferase YrrM